MTTPAVDQDADLNIVGMNYLTYSDGRVYQYGPYYRLHKWVMRHRPQSVSNPPVGPEGGRQVSSWFHRGMRYTVPPLTLYAKSKDGYWTEHCTNNSGFSMSKPGLPSFDESVYARAVNGALEKMKDQSVDLSVAFLEREQTTRLFTDSMKRISHVVKDFRKTRPRDFFRARTARSVREIPSAWLELQYGVSPLLNDVFGSVEALNKDFDTKPNSYRVAFKKGVVETTQTRRTDLFYPFGWSLPVFVDELVEQACFASFTYALRNPILASLSSLGVTNPVSAGYEALPFSFVLDWALPVGNYLNLLDADYGWDYHGGTTSRRIKVRGRGSHYDFSACPPTEYWWIDGDVRGIQYRGFHLNRYVHSAAPWPVYPSFRNPFSSKTRVANSLSLLHEAFNGKVR